MNKRTCLPPQSIAILIWGQPPGVNKKHDSRKHNCTSVLNLRRPEWDLLCPDRVHWEDSRSASHHLWRTHYRGAVPLCLPWPLSPCFSLSRAPLCLQLLLGFEFQFGPNTIDNFINLEWNRPETQLVICLLKHNLTCSRGRQIWELSPVGAQDD